MRSAISCAELGREDQSAVVAVAAALDHLVIVALLGGDVAEARSAARDVGDDAGQLGASHVADTFLHEADAGAAGGGHAADTRRRCAVEHVHGGDFALGLQKDAARLRHIERSGFGDLTGRGDGISVEGAAPGENGALDDGLVALDQLLAHGTASRNSTTFAPLLRAAQHRNGSRLRTDQEADAARRATRTRVRRRSIAVVIELFAQSDHLGWTGLDTEAAAFAFIGVHLQQTSIPPLCVHAFSYLP